MLHSLHCTMLHFCIFSLVASFPVYSLLVPGDLFFTLHQGVIFMCYSRSWTGYILLPIYTSSFLISHIWCNFGCKLVSRIKGPMCIYLLGFIHLSKIIHLFIHSSLRYFLLSLKLLLTALLCRKYFSYL